MSERALTIDVWSDIACPWCYVGKRKLEQALQRFEPPTEVVWHAFELDPSAPREVDLGEGDYVERLAKKYRAPRAHAQEMIDRMTRTGAEVGIEFRFDRVRPGNTFDAHRVIHLAHEHGLQDAMKERLLRAYMTEGELVGDHDALARLATEVGLEPDAVQAVLQSDAHAAEVRGDQAEARALGVTGVPFFVFDRRYAVPGAQPADTLVEVLEKAWSDRAPVMYAAGSVCGPEGC